MGVRVLDHATKHGLARAEIGYAWRNPLRCRQRHGASDPPYWIAIGSLPNGNLAELVAFLDDGGNWCVFHAMTPPTKKFLKELHLENRRKHHGRY